MEGHISLGNILHEMKEYQEAEISYSKAIALEPENWQGYYLRANTYREMQLYQDAIQDFETVLKFSPDHVDNFNFLGITELKLGNPDQAMAYLGKALALQPDNLAVLNNHAYTCLQLLLLNEATASLETALAINPNYAGALFNKSFLKLLMGDYLEGWQLYEWRWQSEMQELKRSFPQATWLGETSLSGKTLFIYSEQGLGDFIQFSRYLSLLASQAAQVILETPVALLSVMSNLQVDIQLFEFGQTLPDFDLQCPLLSLPLACKTDLLSIPKQVPYLQASDKKLTDWLEKLGPKHSFRVGLVWSGSTSHKNDANRSIPIDLLSDFFKLNAEFHCLQKEIRAEDVQKLANIPQLILHHDQIADFDDTAALIAAMDLIISVDTAVAHLAGAMAKPLWVLLPFAPDFRWLLDRTDSPWYPTAKLYRQQKIKDWSTVICSITENLSDLLKIRIVKCCISNNSLNIN
jgi:tetratricopeptide (TPR) repeat protein